MFFLIKYSSFEAWTGGISLLSHMTIWHLGKCGNDIGLKLFTDIRLWHDGPDLVYLAVGQKLWFTRFDACIVSCLCEFQSYGVRKYNHGGLTQSRISVILT